MHFRVVVPTAVNPGQMLRIRCPDGTEGDVKVPRGLKEGDTFIFEMQVPNETAVRDAQREYDEREAMERAGQGGGAGGSPSGGGGGGARRRHGGSGGAAASATAGLGGGGAATSYGFFDREILDSRDFLTALGVGMIIGLSIVGGFLVGVLLVTDP